MGDCGTLSFTLAIEVERSRDVGFDVSKGGESGCGEITCPLSVTMVSEHTQQHSYPDGVACACADIICSALEAVVLPTTDVVQVRWGRKSEKGDYDNCGGLCCSAKSRLGNKCVDRRNGKEGFGCDLL